MYGPLSQKLIYNCALTSNRWFSELSEMLFLGYNPQIWLE